MLTVRFPQLHHSFQRDGQRGRSEYSNVSILVFLLHPFTRSNLCTASLSGVVLRVLGGGEEEEKTSKAYIGCRIIFIFSNTRLEIQTEGLASYEDPLCRFFFKWLD